MQYLAIADTETATVECHICYDTIAACDGFVSTAGRFTCWRCVERERRLGPITEEEAHILAALAR